MLIDGHRQATPRIENQYVEVKPPGFVIEILDSDDDESPSYNVVPTADPAPPITPAATPPPQPPLDEDEDELGASPANVSSNSMSTALIRRSGKPISKAARYSSNGSRLLTPASSSPLRIKGPKSPPFGARARSVAPVRRAIMPSVVDLDADDELG